MFRLTVAEAARSPNTAKPSAAVAAIPNRRLEIRELFTGILLAPQLCAFGREIHQGECKINQIREDPRTAEERSKLSIAAAARFRHSENPALPQPPCGAEMAA